MPGEHARLSASSSARWLACPPSVKLTEGMPNKESEWAAEGTEAHRVAEVKLRNYINGTGDRVVCEDEINRYTNDYCEYVIEQFNAAKKADHKAKLFIEERLDYSEWAREGQGTGDAVIIADNTCHIIDLKYGRNISVSAINNPQLRLYALGAISTYSLIYDFDKVKVHIYQPRIGNISTEELTVAELTEWGDATVRPAAELAYRGEGDFNPGETQCRWCLAKESCKARARKNLKTFVENEDTAKMLTLKDLAALLPYLKEIKSWCEDIEDYALSQMLNGKSIEGYKVVESDARRKVIDEIGLYTELIEKGYAAEQVTQLKPITQLEKLVGKKDFTILSAGYIDKPKGSPAIAPLGDKRKLYEDITADEAFKDIEVIS